MCLEINEPDHAHFIKISNEGTNIGYFIEADAQYELSCNKNIF